MKVHSTCGCTSKSLATRFVGRAHEPLIVSLWVGCKVFLAMANRQHVQVESDERVQVFQVESSGLT